MIEQIPHLAELHKSKSKSHFDVDLDYSEASLNKIDNMINEYFNSAELSSLQTTIVLFGAYVGETIRQLQGGDWIQDEKHGISLANVGGVATIYPFEKISLRFQNGDNDSIAFYYTSLKNIIQKHHSGV